jgi:3-hydroxy-3-methylglutaryl CoA synthase
MPYRGRVVYASPAGAAWLWIGIASCCAMVERTPLYTDHASEVWRREWPLVQG